MIASLPRLQAAVKAIERYTSDTEVEMRSIALPEVFVILLLWGIPIFCVWKFYQILSKINDNVAEIRRAVERNGATPPIEPV
jgi:hypothetical protein